MGTRADFYVGRGKGAKWIGSIGLDGYPDGLPETIKEAESERDFRVAVLTLIQERRSGTVPEQGWPWPWNTSHTTDYAYAFDGDEVYVSCFGHEWFRAVEPEPDSEEWTDEKVAEFPKMDVSTATYGDRSGLLVLGANE